MRDETLADALFYALNDWLRESDSIKLSIDAGECRAGIERYHAAREEARRVFEQATAARTRSRRWAANLERRFCKICGVSNVLGDVCWSCDDL